MIPVSLRMKSKASDLAPGVVVYLDLQWRQLKSTSKAGRSSVVLECDRGRFVRRADDVLTYGLKEDAK